MKPILSFFALLFLSVSTLVAQGKVSVKLNLPAKDGIVSFSIIDEKGEDVTKLYSVDEGEVEILKAGKNSGMLPIEKGMNLINVSDLAADETLKLKSLKVIYLVNQSAVFVAGQDLSMAAK